MDKGGVRIFVEGRDMITYEQRKRKMEEEGRRVADEDFIFLFVKGLFILLLWLTVPTSCIYYVMYLEGLILVKFSSLFSPPLLSSGYISSISSRGGTRSVCLFLWNVMLLYDDSPMSSCHFCHSHSDQV